MKKVSLIYHIHTIDDFYKGFEYDSNVLIVIDVISIFQIASSTLVIISYVLSNGPLILRHRWDEHVSNQRKKIEDFDIILENIYETMSSTLSELSSDQKKLLIHLEGPYSDKVKEVSGVRGLQYYLLSATFICTDGEFVYYIFYCTISVIGLVINPIYTSFLLLDFAVRFDMLKSITKNKVALGMTLMLVLIILFIYASFGFFYFHDMMYTYEINAYDSDTIGESMCDNMIQCFVAVINLGLRNGGGIGDAIKPETFSETESYLSKFFYTFTFHLIVILVMLNIVFGIIIDTFAQLRDEKRFIENDQNNKCYICNMERYIFDQDGNGFKDHSDNDHNMWNYIFYIVHLQTKDPTEYTGVESYVWDKFDQDDITWLPLHRALIIDNPDEEDDGATEDEIAKEKLEDLYQRLKLVSKRVQKLNNRRDNN